MLLLGSWVNSCGLNFIACSAHPSGIIRECLTFFSLKTRLHLTPPFPNHYGGVHTGGPVSGGAGHLSRQTGALHRLWPLLDAVLIAASVRGDHFTCPSFWSEQVGLLESVLEGSVAQQHGAGTYPQVQGPGHRRDHRHALRNPAKSRALC